MDTSFENIDDIIARFNNYDEYTAEHLMRSKMYVRLIADEIYQDGCINGEQIKELENGALLHDLGKLFISIELLLKPNKLTNDEFEKVKKHTLIGEEIIRDARKINTKVFSSEFSMEMCAYHHEKWDGTGYPYGISKDNIPLSARIMAVADVYDALRNKRTYKNALSHDESMNYIKGQSGKHFDPYVVDRFLGKCKKTSLSF